MSLLESIFFQRKIRKWPIRLLQALLIQLFIQFDYKFLISNIKHLA